MGSTKHIGRVGALAVALGIGTALTTGTGIAWADGDAGNGKGVDNSRTTPPAPKNTTTSSDDSTATRTGPRSLSKLADRVRTQVESSVNEATAGLQRTQSRLEKAKARLDDGRAQVERQLTGTVKNLTGEATEGASPARRAFANLRPRQDTTGVPETPATPPIPRGTADSSASPARLVPAALSARPDLSQSQRASTVTLKLKEAGDNLAQRGPAALSAPIDTPVLNRLAAPISAFAEPLASESGATLTAPEPPKSTASSVVSALLVAAGLSPLAGSPAIPGQSPALWALMAWARRESDKEVNPDGVALQSAKDAVSPTAANGEIVPMAAVQATAVDQWQQYPGQTPAPVISGSTSSTQTGWTTGNGSGTGVTDKWWIGGTDLGIMWVSGYTENGKPIVYSLFGDTYDVADPASNAGWRDNVLLRASDFNLNDGLQFSDAVINAGAQYPGDPNGTPTWWRPLSAGQRAGAMQVIDPAPIDQLRGTNTYTLIPTAAIAVPVARDANGDPVVDANGQPVMTQYATVMSIRQWGQSGSWTTNWSAIAVSNDGGKTWTVDPATVRPSSGGNANFQQNAMMYGNPDDLNSYVSGDKTGERYVYVYGTPAGRQGSAYVARVPESQITNLSAYEYFAGDNGDGTGNWVAGQPQAAVAVISSEGATGSIFPETGIIGAILSPFVAFLKFIYPAGFRPGGIFSAGGTSGNVSEMSVQYNEYLDKYVVTYTDGGNNVVMRVSDSPQGTWSNSTVLQANQGTGQNTSMYAPMIHPLSGTDQLGAGNEKYLYYNLSQWNDYNVRMMRADLSRLTIT